MRLNIQLFAGGTITGTSTASVGRVQIVWTATASDAIENKSSVHADVQVKRSNAYNTTGTFSGTLWINGTAFSIKKKFDPLSNSWKTIGGATLDVPHNEDGTKTIEIKTSFSNTGTSMAGTYTASANVQLDTIARASAFNSFTMSVNNDSSISVVASITKRNASFTDTLNICNENITLNNGTNYITFSTSSHATAYNRFYEIMGTQNQANYTAVLTTSSGGSQIGNTSALTAYNVALPNYAISIGTITSSDDNANNYIRSGSTHKVSDFTSANTFLQGWSNPRLSYTLGATYNTLYGRSINITGATTRGGLSLGNDSFTLGTGFTGGTKTLNASDGRKSASNSITLTRKDWATPSVSITLTRESATGTQINWVVSWSYTNVSGGLTPKLNASYTYNGTTTTLISDRSLTQTSGSLSGSFQLANADDYKYPISGNVNLTDMIDYLVQSNIQIPGGLPAIYTHKDSSANNIIDIYGDNYTHGNINTQNGDIGINNTYPALYMNSNIVLRISDGLYVGGYGSYIVLRPKGLWDYNKQLILDTNGNVSVDGEITTKGSKLLPTIFVDGERNTNETPATLRTYMNNNAIGRMYRFKDGGSIGIPNNWIGLETIKHYVDSTGGVMHQFGYGVDGLFYRKGASGDGSWEVWTGLDHTRIINFNGEWRTAFNPYGGGWRMEIPFISPKATRPTLALSSCEYFGTAGWKTCSASIQYQTETQCFLTFSGITDSETRSYMVLIRMTGTLKLGS